MAGRRPASRATISAVVVIVVGVVAAAGCVARSGAAPPTVKVYQSRGAVQCGPRGTPTDVMARTLTEAGIPVLRSACGHDGLMRAAVCGAATGDINIFEIAASDQADAERLGFRELGTLPRAREGRCRS